MHSACHEDADHEPEENREESNWAARTGPMSGPARNSQQNGPEEKPILFVGS